jgi:hypothetical protein
MRGRSRGLHGLHLRLGIVRERVIEYDRAVLFAGQGHAI